MTTPNLQNNEKEKQKCRKKVKKENKIVFIYKF